MSDLKDLTLEEQLMNQLETMQGEIDNLKQQNEKLLEENNNLKSEVSKKDLQLSKLLEQAEIAEKTIQKNLSNISTLELNVQKLTERNEKLNEADKLIQKNEKLEKINSDLQKKIQDTEMTISSVKEEYAEKERKLAETQRQAEKYRDYAEMAWSIRKRFIESEVEDRCYREEITLKANFDHRVRTFKQKYGALFFGALAYGIMVTLFAGIHSKRFTDDLIAFFTVLSAGIKGLFNLITDGASTVSKLGDVISQPTVAAVVHWFLYIAFIVLILGFLAYIIFFGVRNLVLFYKEYYADNTSLVVVLVTLAAAVFFANPIRDLVPINLILLILIVQVVYMTLRWYIFLR